MASLPVIAVKVCFFHDPLLHKNKVAPFYERNFAGQPALRQGDGA